MKNNIFNNKLEFEKYCKMDINILRISCIKFMTDFYNTTNISIFREAMTLASAVLLAYKKNFLRSNTIACITSNYTNHSKMNAWKLSVIT